MQDSRQGIGILLEDIDYFCSSPKVEWSGGEVGASGSIGIPYPNYDSAVDRLIHNMYEGDFVRPGYLARKEELGLNSREDVAAFIPKASMEDLLVLLSFYVRGERFCDGLIASAIESGELGSILTRLKEIAAI